jgi:hypothetical protein
MTDNKINFQTLQSIDDVVIFGENRGKIIGVGSIDNQNLTITNIYHVEDLNFNFLSVSKLCDSRYHIKFDSNDYI